MERYWYMGMGYFILVNGAGFILMGLDKYRAKHKLWRIRESVLLWISILGGSIGTFAGMYCFRHKTKHHKFKWGIPVILILQWGIVLFLLK